MIMCSTLLRCWVVLSMVIAVDDNNNNNKKRMMAPQEMIFVVGHGKKNHSRSSSHSN